jgi:hypothetical protein
VRHWSPTRELLGHKTEIQYEIFVAECCISLCVTFGYCSDSAVAVVVAQPLDHVTGTAMLSLIFISIVTLAYLSWLLFALTVHALPFFVGVRLAFAAHQSGAGAIGALLIGLVAAALTLSLAQRIFVATRSPVNRVVVASIFATPAIIAGYHAALGLSRLTATSLVWQHAFAVIGAITVGAIAGSRIARITEHTN